MGAVGLFEGVTKYPMLAGTSATALIPGQTPVVTRGTSCAPEKGDPGSIYEQLDKDGNLMRRTQYGENGLPEYRQDYSGKPHFSKPENRYIHPHQHNFQYNESNQPIGETVTDIK